VIYDFHENLQSENKALLLANKSPSAAKILKIAEAKEQSFMLKLKYNF